MASFSPSTSSCTIQICFIGDHLRGENQFLGQFITIFIAHTSAEVMAGRTHGRRNLIALDYLGAFCTDLVNLIEASRPTWFSETIDHAKVFWEAKPSSAKYLIGLLQGIEPITKRTTDWLASKGFPKSNISIGVDTGRITLLDREALGTTISEAYRFTAFGMEQREVVVVSQETISILESAWKIKSPLVELKTGSSGTKKPRHVAILPLQMF